MANNSETTIVDPSKHAIFKAVRASTSNGTDGRVLNSPDQLLRDLEKNGYTVVPTPLGDE